MRTSSNAVTGALVIAVILVALVLSRSSLGSYLLSIGVRALIFIALAQAWNIIAGLGGQLSLGHGIFFGFGAYVTAFLFNRLGLSPWIGMWCGASMAILTSFVIGGIAFRLQGVYFALATVVISLALEKLARYYSAITGGDAGLAVRLLG